MYTKPAIGFPLGTARHHARWRGLAQDEQDAAVAELRELAGGRADLLAEVAHLCRLADADETLIPHWIGAERRRAGVGGQPDDVWLPLRMIFVQTISFEMSTFIVFTPPGMNGSTIKAGTQHMVTKISGMIAKATMATRCHEGSEHKIAIPGFTASNRPSRSINVYI